MRESMWIRGWCVIPIEQMKIRMRQGGEPQIVPTVWQGKPT